MNRKWMCLQQVQRIQGVHELQEHQWSHGHQLYRPCQGVREVQQVPEEEIMAKQLSLSMGSPGSPPYLPCQGVSIF